MTTLLEFNKYPNCIRPFLSRISHWILYCIPLSTELGKYHLAQYQHFFFCYFIGSTVTGKSKYLLYSWTCAESITTAASSVFFGNLESAFALPLSLFSGIILDDVKISLFILSSMYMSQASVFFRVWSNYYYLITSLIWFVKCTFVLSLGSLTSIANCNCYEFTLN